MDDFLDFNSDSMHSSITGKPIRGTRIQMDNMAPNNPGRSTEAQILKPLAASSAAEKAASDEFESGPKNLSVLRTAIAEQKDPALKKVLSDHYNQLSSNKPADDFADFSSASIHADVKKLPVDKFTPVNAEVKDSGIFDNLLTGARTGASLATHNAKQALDKSAQWADRKLKDTPLGDAVNWANEKLGLPTTDQALQGTNDSIERTKKDGAEALKTTAGKIGSFVGQAGITAPMMMLPGANTYVGAGLVGAGTGLLTTEGGLKDRVEGAGLGLAGGVAGVGLGSLLGVGAKKLGEARQAKLSMSETVNQGKDRAIELARQSGIRLPPQEVNPGAINATLEGISGKIKTSQSASSKNQPVINGIAAKELGLPEGTFISPQVLQDIRKESGKAYEAVKQIGSIKTDPQYHQKIDGLVSQYDNVANAFPGFSKPEVSTLVQSFKQPEFDSRAAVDAIGLLREESKAAFQKGDRALAKAHSGIAEALEDVIDRNLQGQGSPDLLKNYRDARVTIAKTHSVERALNPVTGDIDASELARQLKKGKPLSGGLKDIAEVATAFPKATQALKQNYNPVSPFDFALGVAGSLHNPYEAALALARPAIRGAILSKPYQALNASGAGQYGGGMISKGVYPALASQPLKNLLRAGGPVAAIETQK